MYPGSYTNINVARCRDMLQHAYMIHAQLMLHCVTSFLVSVLLCHPYIFTIFVENV